MYILQRTRNVYNKKEHCMYIIKKNNVLYILKRTITLYTFTFFYHRGLVHKKNYPKGSYFIIYLYRLTSASSHQLNNLSPLKPKRD